MIKKSLLLTLVVLLTTANLFAVGREVKTFNNDWQFKKGPFSSEVLLSNKQWNGKWEAVTLPHTWNATDMQTKADNFYEGDAYYKKEFVCPESYKNKRIFLRFEGVGAVAEVYINGTLAGTHKGAYSAFAVEIGTLLKSGEKNEIVVKADNSARPDVIPVNHSLFGVYGGIYRPVSLIVTETSNITVTDNASPGVYITQKNVSKKKADIKVKVKLDNATLQPVPVTLENTIYNQAGKKIAVQTQEIMLSTQGSQVYESNFKIKNPILWQGRKNPHLYKVVSRLYKADELYDEVIQPLGIRKFDIVAGDGFYLNGEKYPMYGVCRHQDWWGLGSALENKHHAADIATIMDLGATTVRFAHYQQSDYLYAKCDSVGLIIWAEIPFVNRVTGKESENAMNQMREMIRQSFNHPSIYVWGLHNEVYKPHEYTAGLTQALHDLAKTEDPDRFTVSVNGYGHMEHPVNLNADIQGMNRYFGWYEKKIGDIKPWAEDLAKRYPHQKLMLTEYGADANLNHQTEYLGESLNWWKEFYPETFQTKTHEYHWSVIAKSPNIIASYLWNTFDFCAPLWTRGGVPARNMKGLVTFDRKIKKDSYFFYKANWSEEPVLYLTQRRNKDREKQVTSITIYSNIGEPTVLLNGKKLEGIRKGYTDIHYVIDNVTLAKGKNIVSTTVEKEGETHEDSIEWFYTHEQKREVDNYEHKKEHSGF